MWSGNFVSFALQMQCNSPGDGNTFTCLVVHLFNGHYFYGRKRTALFFWSVQKWTCGQPDHQTKPTKLISTIFSPSQSAPMHNTVMTTIFTSPPLFLNFISCQRLCLFAKDLIPLVSPSTFLLIFRFQAGIYLSLFFLFHMFVRTDPVSHFHPSPWHSWYIGPMFYYLGFPYFAPWCFRCVVQSYKGQKA